MVSNRDQNEWEISNAKGINEMDESIDQTVQAAMSIILNAGDAREENLEAIKYLTEFNITAAQASLKTAHQKITEAHKVQTNQIQEETRGKKSEYSLLFAHAQDTMMTINSEILLTESFLKVFEAYEKRLRLVEGELK